MAAKKIDSDDLILVNRGGVDYQAEVGELPIEDVDLDGYATEDWVKAKGYITSEGVDLDGYATEEWVEAKSYITSDGDGSTLTGVMPLDLRTLPTLT